jgi:hypothetical protein
LCFQNPSLPICSLTLPNFFLSFPQTIQTWFFSTKKKMFL